MSYVFISYFREDKERINPFLEKLRATGIDYWIDTDGIELGEKWSVRITDKIKGAHAFLIFLSNCYLTKRDSFLNEELNIALSHAEIESTAVSWILPIVFDGLNLATSLRPSHQILSTLHHIHAQPDNKWVLSTAERVSNIINSPNLNYSTVHIATSSKLLLSEKSALDLRYALKEHIFTLACDDKIKTEMGWVTTQFMLDRMTEALRGKAPVLPDWGILDINSRPVTVFKIPHGKHHLQVKEFFLSKATSSQYDLRVNGYVSLELSNTLNLNIQPRQIINLQVEKTPVRGIIFRERPVKEPYYLQVVST